MALGIDALKKQEKPEHIDYMKSMRTFICTSVFVMGSALAGHAQEVRISKLVPLNFGVWDSSNTSSFNLELEHTTVCAWKENIGNDLYWVNLDDGTLNSTFQLDDGMGTKIDFNMDWERDGVGTYQNMTEGTELQFQVANQDALNDCSISGDSAKYRVVIPNTNMVGKPPGVYTAQITVFMRPD